MLRSRGNPCKELTHLAGRSGRGRAGQAGAAPQGGGSRWRGAARWTQASGCREPPLLPPPGVLSRSLGSEPAMRRLEEDSEVYKMLQENRELRAAPRQSSTFRLLQEALEDEGGGEGDRGQWGVWRGGWQVPDGFVTHSWPRSPLPQPALAQRPQARGRCPEAARLREMRQHHRVSGAGGWGGVVPGQDLSLPPLPAGPK